MDIFSGKDGEFLGRSSILPQHLKDDGGRLTLTISNKELLPVGVMHCELLCQLLVFILVTCTYTCMQCELTCYLVVFISSLYMYTHTYAPSVGVM